MSSRRLPGKSLRPLAGRPALAYVLERLAHAESLDLIVVATSSDGADDAIARFCRAEGVQCHRGPLDDVAGRFGEVVDRFGLEEFVRISGDSPFLDQRLVDRAVKLFTETEVALVTNVFPRSFPHGQSVEVLRAGPFRAALADMTDPADREHVTPFLYRHPERFPLQSFSAPRDWSDVRLVLDTPEDEVRIATMLARMERPHWDYRYDELVGLAQGV